MALGSLLAISPGDVLRCAIAGSVSVGVYDGDKQVAYGRIVTDRATFAWVCDVFVDADARGRGIGTWMMQAVVEHLQSLGVYRILLATHDAHDVYAGVGFVPLPEPGQYMQLSQTAPPIGGIQH